MKTNWKYILLYILLALGLSYPLQMGYFDNFFASFTKDSFLSGASYLLAGASTAIAALIAMLFHKGLSNRISIFGEQPIKHSLISLLPILAFAIVGRDNDFGMHPSHYGFSIALISIAYAFAEEFGWRRYLQNALENQNRHLKYLLIGVVWWIWHFRFQNQFDLMVFPLFCIGGGYFLGKLADDTKSILPVVSMHALITLTTSVGTFAQRELVGIAAVILGWIVIEQIWKRNKYEANFLED